MRYFLVTVVIVLVTYGQLIIKYEVNRMGAVPLDNIKEAIGYGFSALTSLYILSGLLAAALAALAWIAALSRYELSSVYPLLSLNFVLVPLLSVHFFGESMDAFKLVGAAIIVFGVFVFSASAWLN